MDLDRFLILKGEGIYDLYDFINAAMMGGEWGDVRVNLHEQQHDLGDSEFTGVEGDAAYEAYRKGLGGEAAEIYHAGPQGDNDQRYAQAFRTMVMAGKEIINEAVRQQNIINQDKGIGPMPEPFKDDAVNGYQVNPQWGHKTPIEKNKQKMEDGTINPWDEMTNELVTTVRSGITGRAESWFRPYHQGLDQMRSQSPGPQAGQRKPTSDEIPSHRLHRNSITINDPSMGKHLTAVIQEAAAAAQAAGQDPMQAALQALQQNRTFRGKAGDFKHKGSHEEMFGAYSDERMQQYTAEQEAAPQQPVVMEPNRDNMEGWLSQGDVGKYATHLISSNRHYTNGPGLPRVREGLIDGYGYSEATADEMISIMQNRQKGNAGMALAEAIRAHEMADGVPPQWAAGMEGLYFGENQQPLSQPQAPPVAPPVAPPLEGEATFSMAGIESDPLRPPGGGRQIAPSLPHIEVVPPPQLSASKVSSPPPKTVESPPPPVVGAPNALGGPMARPPQAGFMESMGESLGGMYGRAFPGGLFGKNDEEERNQIETLLEQVQIDIAKREISKVNQPMSPESPVDIAMFAADLNRPSSDVVSVIFSRGDWRNIAKAFNMAHEDVQKIKVTFNG